MQVIKDFFNVNKIEDKTIAVGVSGGADSLALVLMLKDEFPDFDIIALTVDHQLRPSSKDEAMYVKSIMKKFGIKHHILVWKGEKPKVGIEEQARIARYNLLFDWCNKNNVKNLVIAHHLLDQVETFLMRLQRGSGIIGLSSMDEISYRDGVKILRPLLSVHPQVMKNFLKEKNIDWVEDESNQCMDFLRVKIRKILPILEKEVNITPEKLFLAISNLKSTKNFIETSVDEFVKNKMHKWGECAYSVDNKMFMKQHNELKFHIIGRLLKELGKTDYTPESSAIKQLLENLEKDNFEGTTLGGCHIQICDIKLFFIKEYRKKSLANSGNLWDKYLINNPNVRGIKIPYKLKEALLLENLS